MYVKKIIKDPYFHVHCNGKHTSTNVNCELAQVKLYSLYIFCLIETFDRYFFILISLQKFRFKIILKNNAKKNLNDPKIKILYMYSTKICKNKLAVRKVTKHVHKHIETGTISRKPRLIHFHNNLN